MDIKSFLWKHPKIEEVIKLLSLGIHLITLLVSIAVITGILFQHGVAENPNTYKTIEFLYQASILVFLLALIFQFITDYYKLPKQSRRFMIGMSSFLFISLLPMFKESPGSLFFQYLYLIIDNPYYSKLVASVAAFIVLSRSIVSLLSKKVNPSLMLAFSFFIIIFLGSLLLLLPRASYNGLLYIDSLFIATSAVCVTGLVSVDITTTFTPIGQGIIMLLIQFGGLGLMTITSFFSLFFTGQTSLHNQIAVKDMVSDSEKGSLLSMLLRIMGVTAVIEGIGALFILQSIHGQVGLSFSEEVFFSIFHAISAFCNAGFSTMPGNLANPLLQHQTLLLTTISFLIIFGGIGFPIFSNLIHVFLWHIKRLYLRAFSFFKTFGSSPYYSPKIIHPYNLNTKIVLVSTFWLLLVGTLFVLVFEWKGALSGFSFFDKIIHAFFHSVTPRTAGFNAVAMTTFSTQTILLFMALMFIGGGAQSTAGGIKVNAFAVIVSNLLCILRGKERVEIFDRELPYESIRRSNATAVMAFFVIAISFFTLSILEPGIPLSSLLFEVISALGTVGLSLDLTPSLGTGSKWILIVLMFVGRVGVITFIIGLVKQVKVNQYRLPKEQIIIN